MGKSIVSGLGWLALCWSALLPGVGFAEGEAADWRDGPVTGTVGTVQFRACDLASQGRHRTVECARLSVPEDFQAVDGDRRIELFIVRLKSGGARPEPDPVLMLAGGPGQAASESFLFYDRVFSTLSRDRDLYLVDQRGTGRSNPQHCDLDDEQALLVEPSAEGIRAAAQTCLDQFDGDPRQYTTSVAVQDFERVRQALGLARWNLYGVSYGTRVAQHYMRRYPVMIRSSVLDSVVYPQLNLGPDIALHSQQALDRLLARCAGDAACNRRFPELDDGLDSLLRQLDQSPREVVYNDPRTGGDRRLHFTHGHLQGLIRMSLYNSEQASILPPMVHAAYAEGDYSALARAAADIVRQTNRMLAMGLHNAVVCTEDVPFYDADRIDRDALTDTYLGDVIVRSLEETCAVWPEGVLDDGFKSPLETSVPTLLLSGEHDPITPPDYAEQAMAGLSSARHFVAPGQGHSVSVLGCAPVIVAQFVETLEPDNLAGDCLQRLHAAPPFIDFNGPSP